MYPQSFPQSAQKFAGIMRVRRTMAEAILQKVYKNLR